MKFNSKRESSQHVYIFIELSQRSFFYFFAAKVADDGEVVEIVEVSEVSEVNEV